MPPWRAKTAALASEVERLTAIVTDLAGRCERMAEDRRTDSVRIEEIGLRIAALAGDAQAQAIAAEGNARDLSGALATLAALPTERERRDADARAYEQRARETAESIERLHLRLVALETLRIWDAEEMQRLAVGLLEQIERLRRPRDTRPS